MTEDARFEDGREAPLNLGALDAGDLEVISTLVQDAVFPITEMRWRKAERRFALLLNRFRWEDVLMFSNVQRVSSQGVNKGDADTILSLLQIEFTETDAPSGDVLLTLAGDGVIRLTVEALDVTLKDVTRPYVAPSRKLPEHPA